MRNKKHGNNEVSRVERRDWKAEREEDLRKKRRIGEVALGMVAVAIVSVVLAHGVKTSEIMDDEERAKNVKRIEAEGAVFHNEVNAREEPYIDNTDSNVLAYIDGVGESVVIDYDGEAYYYNSGNDVNGGWYGFRAEQLSDELLEDGYVSQIVADSLKSDEKYGDGVVWFNDNYVSVIESNETEWVD